MPSEPGPWRLELGIRSYLDIFFFSLLKLLCGTTPEGTVHMVSREIACKAQGNVRGVPFGDGTKFHL